MKILKNFSFVLLMIAAVLIVSSEVQARGCSVGAEGEGDIAVDKSAPGTKYFGVLTIYYEKLCCDFDPQICDPDACPCTAGQWDADPVRMRLFMRLSKGNDLYLYSASIASTADGDCIDYVNDTIDQQTEIQRWIADIVVPDLYDGIKYPVALKSVENIIEDDNEPTRFTIMDIEIAVQD